MSAPKLAKADRRKAIVDTAAALFAEHGFRGVTTRELAQKVGVTEPVLYEHFKTKKELYTAIIDDFSKEGFETFPEMLVQSASVDNPEQFFGKLASLIVEHQGRHPNYMRLILFAALEKHELASISFERHATCIHNIVIDYIQVRVRSGEFRRIEPALAARAFIGMVMHYSLFELHFGFKMVRASKKRAIQNMTSIFLNGMKAT